MRMGIEKKELEANQKILEDMKDILNRYAPEYMNTSAFMILNRCVDELVYTEQYSRLKDIKLKAI